LLAISGLAQLADSLPSPKKKAEGSMTRKKQVGRCVHCLKDHVELTSDHMFPKAWYPNATPENLEKWQFPACAKCNNRYGKIERDLLNRFALTLDTKHPASAGLVDAALRAIDPHAGRDEKDAAARAARATKVLAELYKGEKIPEDQIIPGLGERWGRPKGKQIAIQIPRAGMDAMTEKIVRGLAYREDGRFIEDPYEIDAYIDSDEGAAVAREMLNKAGKEFKREPGLEIRRATVEGDVLTAIYEITFWQQFKTYATVQKTESTNKTSVVPTRGAKRLDGLPEGCLLLEKTKPVKAGDLWCHQGKEHRVWLPAKLLGEQQPNNDYCRKAASQAILGFE
jgi:hypothetical protein